MLKPEDMIISVIDNSGQGGMRVAREPVGIQIYHKPTDRTIRVNKHRGQFKNRAEALEILEDLVTTREDTDTGDYRYIVTKGKILHIAVDPYMVADQIDNICKRVETAIYLAELQIQRIRDRQNHIIDHKLKDLAKWKT